ncbi:MAG: hypothetical protein LBE34_02420 [Flavobacteriaceae bacterium]|jgi:hypothetical protein|nr:hypothetical protein [Flavobacteriaceae bacterium]
MKNILSVISIIILCTSCFVHKGEWIGDGCRPKNPNFKLVNTSFKETNKLVFNKVYLSNRKSFGIGFYPNGHLLHFVAKGESFLIDEDVSQRNWNNAQHIGYWRVEEEKIKIEYFVCGNSGTYIGRQGEIKGDTIFFEEKCGSNPFKQEICYDKYILSDMSFK